MVGARAVWSQIAVEAGPVGEGPFFSFFFRKKNNLIVFFAVRFWARAKTEEEAVWCEPHRPHQQLGKEDWGPLALCGPEISMPEQAGSCLLTCMNNRVPGPNTTRCCCSRVKVDGAESLPTARVLFRNRPQDVEARPCIHFLVACFFLIRCFVYWAA